MRIENRRQDNWVFAADLALQRRELSAATLRRTSLRYPWASMRVLGLIYMHAIGLRLAGVRTFAHPARASR